LLTERHDDPDQSAAPVRAARDRRPHRLRGDPAAGGVPAHAAR
jgi:hypothetical protein